VTLIYVDVSHHDWDRAGGNLDWPKVRAATSPVMCARATYGDPSGFHPTTRYFADLQRGAKAAGFTVRGAYHNLVHGDAASMKRQVAWFRQQLDAEGCHWAMVDVERYDELVSNGLWPRWDDVLRWQDAWISSGDHRPMSYYLPQWLVRDYYGTADLRQLRGPLVQSHYAGGDGTAQQIYAAAGGDTGTGWDDRYGNRLPDIWQYTSTGNVPGASSYTDCNAYRGTLESLTALLTGDDMALTDDDIRRIWSWRVRNEASLTAAQAQAWVALDTTVESVAALTADVTALRASIDTIKVPAPAPLDAAAIKAALLDPAVVAVYAKAAADLVHADLAD